MTIYYYKKAPIKIQQQVEEKKTKKTEKTGRPLIDIIENEISKIRYKIYQSHPLTLIVPILLIIGGLGLLYRQLKPVADHYIQSKFSNNFDQEIITLVPESYAQLRSEYIQDPGNTYFSSLNYGRNPVEEDLEITGKMYITIESANLHEVPIEINVDSLIENAYQEALSKGVAHFKGSSIPGISNGNVFVYGHSAAGDYAYKNPKDPVTAFTRLFELTLGDEIIIKRNNVEYKYMVRKIKEIDPDEVEVTFNNSSNTLTLMTCSPAGLNIKRLVIVANEVK